MNSKTIFSDITIRMGGLFYAKGIAFISSIILARLLGPKDFGHVNVALSVLNICGIFSGGGLVDAMLTYVSRQNDNNTKHKYFVHALILCVVAVMLTIAIAYVIIKLISPLSDKVGETLALYCLPAIIFLNINQFLTNYVQSFGSVRIRTLMEIISGSIYSFILVFVTFSLGIHGWPIGMNAGFIISFFILILIFYNYLSKKNVKVTGTFPYFDINIIKLYYKYFSWSTLGKGFNVAIYGVNAIIISQLVDNISKVGIYSAAMMIFSAFGLYAQSISNSIFHIIARKHDDYNWLKRVGIKLKIIALIPLGLLIIVATFMSNQIILMTYGSQYVDSVSIVNVLLIASFFQNYIYLNGGIWVAIGKIKLVTTYYSIVSFVYLILVISLTATLSIIGTAYAMLFSVILGVILSEFINYRYLWTKKI